MPFGNLKVGDLIYESSGSEVTVSLASLVTNNSPAFTGTATGVNLTLSGNLTVNGTQTIINTQTLDVEDKQIEIGKVASPSDTTADQGGWKLKGATDKTFLWLNATDSWTSSEHIEIASGKNLKVDGTTFFVDGTNDRVGIGTTSPATLLDIQEGTTGIRFNRNNNTPELQFKANSVNEAGEIRVGESSGGGVMQFHTKTGGGTLTQALQLDTSQNATFTGDVYLKDGKKLILGDDSDINIKHQSTHFEINNTSGNTFFQAHGQFSLRCSNSGSTETYLFASPGGAVELFHDNSKKFQTASHGINFYDLSDTDILLQCNTSSGVAGYIYGGGDNELGFKDSQQHWTVKGIKDGAVELYHNNSKSFYTTDYGAVMQGYEGVAGIFELHADEGDDNADKWRFVAESGAAQLSIGNYSTGSWVNSLTITGSNNATFGGTVSDSKGDLRSIPTKLEANAYTLVAADAGKCVSCDNGCTVPNNVFAAGDIVTIINSATSDKTITQGSGLTMRNVGDDGNYGNVTVKKYAMSTIIFTHPTVCFFSTTAAA